MGHARVVLQILKGQSLHSLKRDMIEVLATKTVMEMDTSRAATSLASTAAMPRQQAAAIQRAVNLPVEGARPQKLVR